MSAKDLVFTVLGIDKASKTFDGVGDSMDRMAGRGAKAMGLLTASSAAGAAAVAASTAAIPLAFAGLGAVALRENTAVRKSFSDLSNTIRTGIAGDAKPLADTFVGSANEIARAYKSLSPDLREGFRAAKPHVEALTRGVTGFATEAVPGMVSNIRKAGPVFDGLESFMVDAGRATGDFFDIIGDGAPGAGAFFEDLGNLTEDALPDVGRALVELTGVWEEHGDQAVRVIADLLDVVVDLGTGAMPIASDAMGVGLDVLEGILGIVGPLADELGPLIGIWLAMSLAMRTMGAVSGVVNNVTGTIRDLHKESATAAGPTGLARVSSVASSVMGMLGGPWGIALSVAMVGLALFGQESQQAANDQRALAGSLKESAGAFDGNARATIAGSDGYKEVADSVREAGLSQGEYVDALVKGGPQLDSLKRRLEEQVRAGESVNTESGEMVVSYTDQAAAAKLVLDSTNGLRETITGAEQDFKDQQQAVRGSSDAMTEAVPGSNSYREALKVLGDTAADTTERADALNRAWKQLFGVEISVQEATAAYQQGMADLREQIEETKNSVGNWKNELLTADGQINTSTAAGRDLLANLVEQGDGYRTLAQTAYDTTLRQTGSQEQATEAARRAVTDRRNQFITEMQQMGFNERQARSLADTYLGMPDDVLTFLKLLGVEDFEARVRDATRNRELNIFLNQRQGSKVAKDWLTGGMNDGGLVPGGGPDRDSVPTWLTPGEFVVRRSATRRWLPMLQRINRAAGGDAELDALGMSELDGGGGFGMSAAAAGQMTMSAGPQLIVLELRSSGSAEDDYLLERVRRGVRVRGGNVQLVLGGG